MSTEYLGAVEVIGPPADVVHVGVPMLLMDEQEARAIVTRIKTRIDITRGELLELHDREGWRALGYSSWGACVTTEFEGSSTALYRQLSAAKIEREVFGDSRFGNPVPASQLEVVKDLPTEQKRAAFKRADELAGDTPRTAKHIAQAAAEIASPDLPPEFAIVQRRLAAYGHVLSAAWDGKTQRYVIRTEGGTGVVVLWPDVLSKLERLEQQASTIIESTQPAIITNPAPVIDHPDPEMLSDRAAYEAKQTRDDGRLLRARTLIGNGEVDAARVVLAQIEVATWSRDQLLETIPTVPDVSTQARTFLADQAARLPHFSPTAMISQTTFKEALGHIRALLELAA